jgi:hypothetical protein
MQLLTLKCFTFVPHTNSPLYDTYIISVQYFFIYLIYFHYVFLLTLTYLRQFSER